MSATPSLLGRGWAFPVRVNARGGIATAEGEDDIAQAVRLVLATAKGERVMRPGFGCGIHGQVFSAKSYMALDRLSRRVAEALRDHEPRIEVDRVAVTDDPADEARLRIEVSYRVRRTNARHNLVYPFYLKEGE